MVVVFGARVSERSGVFLVKEGNNTECFSLGGKLLALRHFTSITALHFLFNFFNKLFL